MKTHNSFLGTLVYNDEEYALVFDCDVLTVGEAYQLEIGSDEMDILFLTKDEFKAHPDAVSVIKKHDL